MTIFKEASRGLKDIFSKIVLEMNTYLLILLSLVLGAGMGFAPKG